MSKGLQSNPPSPYHGGLTGLLFPAQPVQTEPKYSLTERAAVRTFLVGFSAYLNVNACLLRSQSRQIDSAWRWATRPTPPGDLGSEDMLWVLGWWPTAGGLWGQPDLCGAWTRARNCLLLFRVYSGGKLMGLLLMVLCCWFSFIFFFSCMCQPGTLQSSLLSFLLFGFFSAFWFGLVCGGGILGVFFSLSLSPFPFLIPISVTLSLPFSLLFHFFFFFVYLRICLSK